MLRKNSSFDSRFKSFNTFFWIFFGLIFVATIAMMGFQGFAAYKVLNGEWQIPAVTINLNSTER